jgi:hypothetical protein
MPLNKPVPVASIPFSHKEGSVIDMKSFVASLLVRTSSLTWELTNEYDDDMVQLEWDGDEGRSKTLVSISSILMRHSVSIMKI